MNKSCHHLDNLDSQFEISLRPPLFDQFCGQENVIERLKLLVEASLQRHEPLQHILLSGPTGLGKTTLAHILGNAMQAELRITSGPTIEKAGDLAGLLTTMPENGILFIDEIHRLQPVIEEYLYPAMEDFRVDILIDQGPNARSVRLKLPPFTLLGATTRTGMLTAPLRSRFGMSCRLEYYSNEELKKIILRSGTLLRMNLDEKGALEIANRSRGTPRIANNLLRWVRDYTQVRTEGHITQSSAIEALNMLKIDPDGCDEMDRKILEIIIEKFGGGPVGINSLAIAVGEEAETLEEIHEQYLIMQGYIKRTHQGRVAMRKAYQKLEKIFPDDWNQQKKLI